MKARPRRFRVFTCDRGRRWVNVDRDPPERIAKILQEIVDSGFWRELDKFPADAIEKALPRLSIAQHTRRLLEIWIEERGEGGRAA